MKPEMNEELQLVETVEDKKEETLWEQYHKLNVKLDEILKKINNRKKKQ